MSIFQTMISRVVDAFAKNNNSNFSKLFIILSEKIDELNDTFTKIENWRDINQAEGKALDDIATNYGQKRGTTSDEILRVLIKARIARNMSDGTINKMIEALARSLDTETSTIKIKPLFSQGEPAALMIEGIPIDALNRTGLTIPQFGYIAQAVAGAGIRVASVDLSGTFTFSSQSNVLETSTQFGFAPLNQSSGGTLGASFDPDEESQLPL
jgi:hypothetical protein